jgi:hypothetical protein
VGDSHQYYFSDRGEFRTDAVTSTDLSLNYRLPIRRFELFAQGQLLNAFGAENFNDIYLTRMELGVRTLRTNGAASGLKAFNPFTETPIECPQGQTATQCKALGAHWQKAAKFGEAINKDAYQSPRTYRFSLGLRF